LAIPPWPNGNYTIDATYDEANKQMVFKATGDNNQTFTATLSESALAAAYGTGGTKSATLNFSTAAPPRSPSPSAPHPPTTRPTATTMKTLASDISDSVTLSAPAAWTPRPRPTGCTPA
jgi:hypothetical protein